jgi:lysophospholipase L1-like esterase
MFQSIVKNGRLWRFLLVAALLPGLFAGQFSNTLQHRTSWLLQRYSQPEPQLALLQWPENLQAVRYELEIFSSIPEDLDAQTPVTAALYRNDELYGNQLLLPESQLPDLDGAQPLLWRVRALDMDGNPVGDFSQPAELTTSLQRNHRYAPEPRPAAKTGPGTRLLYPVYSYTALPGATQYEVEILDDLPQHLDGILPSGHRVYAETTELTDLYDKQPRIGTYYWRVRGMDKRGLPVGEWSLPQKVSLDPDEGIQVGVYGDSISHGGGHMSFSPSDFAYSYSSYLNVPVVNLSESGDTSEMMVDRFEQDVLPFHLKTLLIMGGTNSLRDGVSPDDVIADLKKLQELCRENGITPVLLTLAPINPANIQRAFDEDSDPHWQEAFAKVNAYIRTQPHIDVATPFEAMGPELPTEMALDGLHGDVTMKKIMGETINKHLQEFL